MKNNNITVTVLLGLALLPARGWTSCGDLDPGHNPYYGANDAVSSSISLSSGNIVIGGWFTSYYGSPRYYIARLTSSGANDPSYYAALNGAVFGLAKDWSDGTERIVAVGPFGTANFSYPVTGTARFLADGNYDTSFSSPNIDVYPDAVAVTGNGEIYIGGGFNYVGGHYRPRIARLNGNGTVDTTFNAGTIYGHVYAIKLASAKVLIGGTFTSINGTYRDHLASLNQDGSLDSGFTDGHANGTVYAIDSTGSRTVIGGDFTMVNGTSSPYLAVLDSSGALVATPPAPNGTVKTVQLTFSGMDNFAIGGGFTTVGGTTSPGFALFQGGTLAPCSVGTGFTGGGPPTYVNAISIIYGSPNQAFCGGNFTSYKGTFRNRVAQILLE